MSTTPAAHVPGETFTNGTGALHAPTMDWSVTLTVVRHCDGAYGTDRYTVRDSRGRHGYAFAVSVR